MIKPLQVGITGGIGSGKTTVCEVFQLVGIPVYNSDLRARVLMEESPEILDKIRILFGEGSILRNGKPDRQFIGQIVFKNPNLLEQLNSAIHPLVAKDYRKWQGEQKNCPYTLKEAALLIETGSYRELDSLIVVTAPKSLRVNRVLFRDPHRKVSDIEAIINQQTSDEQRGKLANFVIENDESQLVIEQILKIHETLTKRA